MNNKIKQLACILPVILLAGFLFSQEIIENPEKPMAPNAGRELLLDEVLRITDESGDYYFKYPRDLKIGPDGCIFLADEFQLLKFSSDGGFLRNYFKKGQGPGEIQDHYWYEIEADGIYIFDPMQQKIIHLDPEGELVKQYPLNDRFGSFYGIVNGQFLFSNSIWPPVEERTGKMMEMENRILHVSFGSKIEKISPNFPIPAFMGPRTATWWVFFLCALDQEKNILYISHTEEYLIETLDLEKNQVIRRFRRKYPRVNKIKRTNTARPKRSRGPERKYENDISQIFYDNGLLWVETSFNRDDKGTLIDIFNENGRYVDCFFLKTDGSLMAVRGDYVYVREKDEMENIEIVKYRLRNGMKSLTEH